MATIVKVKKIGNSIYLCLKQEICNKIPDLKKLKNNDELIIGAVEISKDLTSHTATIWLDNDTPNALIIKKNTNIIQL